MQMAVASNHKPMEATQQLFDDKNNKRLMSCRSTFSSCTPLNTAAVTPGYNLKSSLTRIHEETSELQQRSSNACTRQVSGHRFRCKQRTNRLLCLVPKICEPLCLDETTYYVSPSSFVAFDISTNNFCCPS